MKRLLLCTVAVLALAACQEDEEASSEETETETSQSAEPATPEATEDTATANDGGGAMDGAEETSQAEEPAAEESTAAPSEVTQDAIDACIDALRAQEGGGGGTVQSTEFSEANSLVMLQDENGNTWRCLVSNDGSGATVEAQEAATSPEEPATEDTATADDGGGAIDGSEAEQGTPSVGSPTDVTDFQGAPAGQAPGGLRALGFESMRTEGLTTYWFNRETGAFARITTSEGVYSEVVMLPAEDC